MTEPRYPYVHVHVSEEEADLLAAELFELGAQGVEQRDGTTLDAPVGSAGATLIASFPDEAGAHAAAEALSDYGAEVAFVVGDEWRDGWKKYFKPSRVGQRFVVRPSWEPWDAQPEDVVIEIDPGRAFGSGIHETTRLVLTVIDGHMEEGVRVLDVGCGSGILAIGAVLRGAVHADCIDNDADVIPVTLENAEINGVAERIAASATPVGELSGRYDWVLANIEARILVPLARDIAARVKPGGWLVLSGVLDGQQGEVLGAYPGFSLASERRENDWVALLLRAESPGVMTTRRLYVREIPGEGDRVILDGGASRHIRVLRLRVGDTLSLFDGRGREVLAEVEELGAAGVRCKIGAPVPTALGSIPVTLIQALPKANKMDGIVRMATELGVDAVYPVTSHRAVPKVEGTKSEQRVQRWNRIAAEASRQSSRATVPRVHPIGSLAEVAQGVPVDALRIVFWEEARGAVLSPEWFSDPSSIWLLVGPEGGLEAGEVEPLLEAGWALSGLGSTVLRVETAGPVALALVMDRLRTRIR